jgi:2-oxoglutarate ferredoxin oxidoreductase subunit alpha
MMALAFDLAEQYRHPVLIASDAAIGQVMEPVELPEFVEHDINKFDWTLKGCKEGEPARYCSNVYYFMGGGYGHDDVTDYYPAYLAHKYAEIEANEQRWEEVQIDDAELILVAYGCSARIAKETVIEAREQGLKLGLIRPITLWPFPNKAFENIADSVKAFMTVEVNILGQMGDDVRLATKSNYPVEFTGSFFSVPDPAEIIANAKKILGK